MIFMCSRKRPKLLQRFFMVSRPLLPGRVLIDEDDSSYENMELPPHWKFSKALRASTVVRLNGAQAMYPDEDYYAVICDDMMIGPSGWDTRLKEAAARNHVAWGDDRKWGDKLCTSFFVGGDLVRTMGFLQHPAFGHLFVDKIWWEIAQGAGLARYCPDVIVQHTKVADETYLQRSIRGDREMFDELKKNGTLKDLIERAKDGHPVHIS